jgi:hypothetical protein
MKSPSYFSSNKSGIYNVYSVPVSGGEPKQLTRSTTESTFSIDYFPKDSRILYTHDQGGNENNHIYVLGANGHEKDLTPGDKLKAQFLSWTRDGSAFYIYTNERDQRFLISTSWMPPALRERWFIRTLSAIRSATFPATVNSSPSRNLARLPIQTFIFTTSRQKK